MANELSHQADARASAGVLTQAENDSITAHQFDSQAIGDLAYASSSTQLSRLGIGTPGQFLAVSAGLPTWTAALTLVDDANLPFGTDADAAMRWSQGDASNETLVIALANANQSLHITDVAAIATDWNISAVTHPTIYIHSNTTPATDYVSIGGHDGTVATIDVVGGTTLIIASILRGDGGVTIADNKLLAVGEDSDGAIVNSSAGLSANTALTGVLIGTPVTPAIAANSIVISNVTASGDIMMTGNTGGHSKAFLTYDSSAEMLTLGQPTTFSGTLTVGVDDTGHDVKLFGAAAGAYMEWDASEDQLRIMGASADATTSTGKLLLATSLTDINANDVIGKIDFQAPHEATGTDAIAIAASIAAVAQATFTATVNSTDLIFYTGHSEAATEKFRMTSQGELGIGGANYGTDGQVLTSGGAGAAAAWENITTVGTIGTGVWQGTAIASTYIAADAITGAKIADDAIDSEHYTDGSIDNAHIADDAIDSEHYADGSIDTAHIANDAITLAKMAAGTDGNIISYDANGDPVAIATGNDGQVLTSAGAGAPPVFEDAAAAGVTITQFTSSDNWSKPSGATWVKVILLGAGGGGGGGRRTASNANAQGGTGGGGGGFAVFDYLAADLASTCVVTIGTAGSAGSAASGDNSNGGNGGDGGNTTFASVLGGAGSAIVVGGAMGGKAGEGGETTTAVAGFGGALRVTGTTSRYYAWTGGVGGTSSIHDNGDYNYGYATTYGGGGGGGGGSIQSSNTQSTGGLGSASNVFFNWTGTTGGGAQGTAGGGAGGAGTASKRTGIGGAGGGGGGSNLTGAGGAGGAGGQDGAGGGGGGASVNGNASGVGAAGGAGYAVVISFP